MSRNSIIYLENDGHVHICFIFSLFHYILSFSNKKVCFISYIFFPHMTGSRIYYLQTHKRGLQKGSYNFHCVYTSCFASLFAYACFTYQLDFKHLIGHGVIS